MPIDNENSMTNLEQAEKLWAQLLDSPALTETDQLIAENHREALLVAFARSAFLAETLVQKPAFISRVVELVSDSNATCFSTELKAKLESLKSEDELLKELREFRNQEMARITFLDVLNKQHIEASLAQVSALADALITSAYHWIYQHLAHRYGTPKSNSQDMHMYILGMGKLGGRELNFSSDIDLIFAYPEKGETSGGKKALEHQQFFTKLAQKLIQALNKVTNDGQVYRVDMRLRPFGDSGPLVMHFAALEDYYQDQGRHWERFAMIKARVINDNHSDDVKWLNSILQPFTFRRYLDFTTLDALRNMK